MRLLVIGAVVGLLVGCGSARPGEKWFALTERYEPRKDVFASVLIRVDPQTLQPLDRGDTRLGDYTTSRALSPDRRTLAFGGRNDGEVLFVDLARPKTVRRLRLARPGGAGVSVDVIGWPRATRLFALATPNSAWWAPKPSRLVVVDPEQRRILGRTTLRAGVLASVSLRDGTVALLGIVHHVPTVLVLRPDGSTWTTRLRIDLGGSDGLTLSGIRYAPKRMPALATDGARFFVVTSDRPIVEILPRTREVHYHRVALQRRYVLQAPVTRPGSGGIQLSYGATAAYLGAHELAIGGYDELPASARDGSDGHRLLSRRVQIIDTRTWRRTRTLPVTSCTALRGVRLCRALVGGFPPDAKGARGSSLVAYNAQWQRLYVKRSTALWWDVVAGRVIAGAATGASMAELDPATGRRLRTLSPAPLANDMWPFDLIRWTPP